VDEQTNVRLKEDAGSLMMFEFAGAPIRQKSRLENPLSKSTVGRLQGAFSTTMGLGSKDLRNSGKTIRPLSSESSGSGSDKPKKSIFGSAKKAISFMNSAKKKTPGRITPF
jgi:hypothetical protein